MKGVDAGRLGLVLAPPGLRGEPPRRRDIDAT